jgi:hypothetical protein
MSPLGQNILLSESCSRRLKEAAEKTLAKHFCQKNSGKFM